MKKFNLFRFLKERKPDELHQLLENMQLSEEDRALYENNDSKQKQALQPVKDLDKTSKLVLSEKIMRIHSHKANTVNILGENEEQNRSNRFKSLNVFNLVRALLIKDKVVNIFTSHYRKERIRHALIHLHHLIAKMSQEKYFQQSNEENAEIDRETEKRLENERDMQELEEMQKDVFQKVLVMLNEIEQTDETEKEVHHHKEEMLKLIHLTPQFQEMPENEHAHIDLGSIMHSLKLGHHSINSGKRI